MSIDQLLGSTIQLVLYIKEGHGFGFLTSDLMITSSLLGHVLSTDVQPSSADPHFDYELTYEVQKKLVKRLRMDNTSLKIDCYSVGEGRKDKIGYILLNLKELQIVGQGLQATESWHRVLGVGKIARGLKPELLISFYITDISKDDPILMEQQNKLVTWKKSDTEIISAYVKKDGNFIQLGQEKPNCKFILTMSVVNASGISQMMAGDNNGVDVIFTMFGYSVKTKAEKPATMNIKSTMKYFEQLAEPIRVELKVMFGEMEVGTSYFTLEDIAKDLGKVVEKSCEIDRPNLDAGLTVSLDIAVSLTKESARNKKTMNLNVVEPCKLEDKKTNKKSHNTIDHAASMPSVRLNLTSLDRTCPKTAPGGSTYRACEDNSPQHHYILTVVLDSLQLSEIPAGDEEMSFGFEHPGAIIKLTTSPKVGMPHVTNEMISIPTVQAEMHFKLSTNTYQNALRSTPPRVNLYRQDKVLCYTLLHLGILFSQDQKKCSYTAMLEGDTNVKGLLGVTMSFQDITEPDIIPVQSSNEEPTTPSIDTDEQLIVKTVEELEDWKEKQMEIFKAELAKKEHDYMRKVKNEWEEKKHRLEQALLFNVENSQKLLDTLNSATENMRLRELRLQEKEMKLHHEKEELKHKYTAKTEELRIALQRTREDQAVKNSKDIIEKIEGLEKKVKLLESERETLKKAVQRLEEEKIKQEGFLNKEQADTVMKELENMVERFEKEKQSKMFYKTEWGKSIREQRKMKKLYDDVLRNQKARKNQELEIAAIQQIASAHEKAMQDDHLRLFDLKSEVLEWNKGQSNSVV